MKRSLLTILLSVSCVIAFGQTTYYWVGGTTAAGGASGGWNTGTNWNTVLDGSGTSRPTATTGNTDVLVFDGTNVGGGTPAVGTVTVDATSNEFGGLKVINGATVNINRFGGSGTTTFSINGDANTGTLDFVVAAGSSLALGSAAGATQFTPVATVTGQVNGSISFFNGAQRLNAPAGSSKAIVFKSGSSFTQGTAHTGNPFGTTGNAPTNDNISFEAGATYTYVAGSNPFGATAPASVTEFQQGSSFIVNTSSAIALSNRGYGNLIISTGSQTTTGAPSRVGTLQVNTGATLTLNTSSTLPITGNLIINGTIAITAAPTLLFCGSGTQTISGTGTSGGFNRLLVGTNATVELARNLSLLPGGAQTSGINGVLNLNNFVLTGNSVSTFSVRSAASVSVTGDVTANNTTVPITSGTGYSIGQSVSGPGIQPNTVIISTTGGIILSLPPTVTTPGASLNISNGSGTLTTANTGGLDAALPGFTAYNFGATSSVIFKEATTSPFPNSLTAVSLGNLINEAAISTNKIITVNGTLTLTSGKLTIRPTDSIIVASGNAVAGGPFSAAKYVVTALNAGNVGILRMNNLSAASLFPIGSSANYLPATVSPVSTSDFSAAVFEGITAEGTPNGTPFTAGQKQTVVDAVWNVSRINGTGDATLTTMWPQSLEGSTFTSQPVIGIMHHDGSIWGPVTGSGDNANNTATATFNSFSPFAVAVDPTLLPTTWQRFSGVLLGGKVKLNWTTVNDIAILQYEVERSLDGVRFTLLGTTASNKGAAENHYSFADASPAAVNYYRIKSLGNSGEIKYSTVLKITTGKTSLQLYPNPVTETLTVTGLPVHSKIRIVNMAGVVIQQLQPNQPVNAITLSVGALQKGQYVLQIIAEGAIETKAFTKL